MVPGLLVHTRLDQCRMPGIYAGQMVWRLSRLAIWHAANSPGVLTCASYLQFVLLITLPTLAQPHANF